MVIVPEMIGSIVGVYNGKTFNQVEIKVNYSKIIGSVLSLVPTENSLYGSIVIRKTCPCNEYPLNPTFM